MLTPFGSSGACSVDPTGVLISEEGIASLPPKPPQS